MSISLSNLVDNLFEGFHNNKFIDCTFYFDYMSIKDDQVIFRCFDCKNNYKKDLNKELIKRSANIYEFCDEYINKFILLLRKGVFAYEYMHSWKRFNETSLPNKKVFYSSLNTEDITVVDYRHAKKVFRYLNNNNLGDYHDLYLQSDRILPADVLPLSCYILAAPKLAWQSCLEKTEIKLELLTDVNMLLLIEKKIRSGICHTIHRYAEANNKYIKNYNKNKDLLKLMYLDANNLIIYMAGKCLKISCRRILMEKMHLNLIKSL